MQFVNGVHHVQDVYILNKSENATPELFTIYKMMQARYANVSLSECSMTVFCTTVIVLRMLSRGNT